MKNLIFSLFFLGLAFDIFGQGQGLGVDHCSTDHSGNPWYRELSFYVTAHQDDWQLFMGTNAKHDILNYCQNGDSLGRGGARVVLIYITAGDVDTTTFGKDYDKTGAGQSTYDSIPYWHVRENGAINSVDHAAQYTNGYAYFNKGPIKILNRIFTTAFGNDTIKYYEYNNTISYFLRLPDRTQSDTINFVNFQKVYRNRNAFPTMSISTVDTIPKTYSGWNELKATLCAIYSYEMSEIPGITPWLNIHDIDTTENPGDHKSHYAAAQLALDAVQSCETCMYTSNYIGYHSENLAVNLSPVDIADEAGLMVAYHMALVDGRIWNEWNSVHVDSALYKNRAQNWCARNYYSESYICGLSLKAPQDPLIQIKSSSSEKSNAINIYPIPSNDILKISQEYENIASITLINQLGKHILHTKQTSNLMEIDIENLPSGIYFLVIELKDKSLISKKVSIIRQ